MSQEFNQQDVDAENRYAEEQSKLDRLDNIRYVGLVRYLPSYLKAIINQRLKEGRKI